MYRRRVMGDRISYIGLDVHKDGIVVAVADSCLANGDPIERVKTGDNGRAAL
jgi:hypothetical protein